MYAFCWFCREAAHLLQFCFHLLTVFLETKYFLPYRCLKWNGLPSVCHMLPPAAGKCCSKPLCPSYVQLQYPPGYVEPDCPTPCSTP